MDIINDPNKLKPMLIEAIDKLKERESTLKPDYYLSKSV